MKKKKATSTIELYKLMGLDDVDFDFEFSAESAKSRDRPPENGPQLLLTTEQARHTLQISRSHLYTLLARGKIASVTIGRSRRGIRLVRLAGSSFFETLRKKLNWSGSNV